MPSLDDMRDVVATSGVPAATSGVPAATSGAQVLDAAAAAGVAPALEARGITLSWDGLPVVEDVSITLGKGELACLVGRSGCGKTTLFHALAGLSRPDAGTVLLHGTDVTGTPGRVSYMLQKDLLLPNLTIVDNASLPLVIRGTARPEARKRAAALLGRFGLEDSGDLWPSQLSGGMRQRAALLRTYLMDNDVVLLDEPFSALDALTRVDMRNWFCGIVADLGLSALVITHDVDEAVAMASRIYVMGGNPAAGVPSRICGEVAVPCAPGEREGFDLTEDFLATKREVLGLLG